MDKNILVLGSDGMVGSRFLELSQFKGQFHTPKQVELDLTNFKELRAVFNSYDFSDVINFAAYTDVTRAEEEREDKTGNCWNINVNGVENLANAIKASKKKIHFIHISTDMVFSGNKFDPGPYSETHPIEEDLNKVTWYGYTKGRGEKIASEILRENMTTLRIIYPVRSIYPQKQDYLRKPLSLYDQGKLYPLFSDQQISISFIDEIATTIDKIIKSKKYGIYHASSKDTSNPFELVSYLLEKTRGVKNVVLPTTIKEFIKKTSKPSYRYPLYGGLSVEKTEKDLGIRFSTWKEIIDKLVKQGI